MRWQTSPEDLHPYTKGKTHNAVSIAGSSNSGVDLATTGYSTLLLVARMTASASGDISLSAFPYEDDGTTISLVVLPGTVTTGPTLSTGVDYIVQRVTLGGADKVRVVIFNNNVGTETATAVYFLQK